MRASIRRRERSGRWHNAAMRTSVALLALVLAACAGAGGSSDGGACSAGQVRCDGTCIDPMSDPMHCGAGGNCAGDNAGMACDASSTCEQGACVSSCEMAEQTFSFTGGVQNYTVPPGVTSVRLDASGAQGGDANGGTTPGIGGRGGHAAGTLAVTPGQQLLVLVGGRNGFNGGGTGGAGSSTSGNGGGASDVRTGPTLGARVIVAAGGGGGAGGPQVCPGVGGAGGAGGGAGGLIGANGTGCSTNIAGPGGGGTASAGGAGGTPSSNCGLTANPGVVGAHGVGGAGGTAVMCNTGGFRGAGGGGGGGGIWGGGGGAAGTSGDTGSWGGGGGGGGASFVGTLVDASMTPGVRTGDGAVTITTICP